MAEYSTKGNKKMNFFHLFIFILILANLNCATNPIDESDLSSENRGSSANSVNNQLYIGTFTPNTGSGLGIYQFSLDYETANWSPEEVVVTLGSPSFIIANRNGNRLYAVNELYNEEGEIGAVSAYELDPVTGNLQLINSQPSAGNGPTHLALDPTESYILVANYGTGNIICLPLDPNGGLGSITDNVLPYSKPDVSPNAHMVVFHPLNSSVVAAVFLGLDQVLFYNFDPNLGKLHPINIALDNDEQVQLHAGVSPGSGSRHLVYDSHGRYIYVVSETGNTVTVFDSTHICNGSYSPVQTISTLPADFKGVSYGGEIGMHPNGKFLYVSNRGHDSIVAFSVSQSSGILTPIQFTPSQGSYPRHFTINKDGSVMIIANQNSGNVVEKLIDSNSGYLRITKQILVVPTPTCALLT